MIAAYVLIGAIGGILGYSGALLIGISFWVALLFYPAGGLTLILLSAVIYKPRTWELENEDRDCDCIKTSPVGREQSTA